MITTLRERFPQRQLAPWLIAAVVLMLAAFLGRRASPTWLGLIGAVFGGVILLARPAWGLPALILVALAAPIEFSVSTDVTINLATALVPILLVVWLLDMARRGHISPALSAANRPLRGRAALRLGCHRSALRSAGGGDGRPASDIAAIQSLKYNRRSSFRR